MAAGIFCRLLLYYSENFKGESMDKRIRDRIKRIEKLEIELLSDEQIIAEKKEVLILVEAVQNELLRRIIMMAAFSVMIAICVVGLLANPTPLNLLAVLVSIMLMIAAIVQYTQKYRNLSDLYKAADKLYITE